MTALRTVIIIAAVTAGMAASAQRFDMALAPCGPGPANSVAPLHSDSLCSSFLICVPLEVKAHYHARHTEHVVVLEGEAEMLLGDSVFTVRAGDAVAIPKGTVHAVSTRSKVPLKVVSVQSPHFDGSDRVPVER